MSEINDLIENIDANEDVTDMAEAIVRVADAAEKLLNAGLERKAIVLLIQHKIGTAAITKGQIENVLWAIPRLRDYLS